MSDHIPFEIQMEVMNRLPVRSLIQFRSISKTWKSLIDSSEFVSRYNSQQNHIFVTYPGPDYNPRYVSVVDDHTFPLNRVFLTPPPRFLVEKWGHYWTIGSSLGLLCFYIVSEEVGGIALLWNPSIRRAYDVVVPNINVPDPGEPYCSILGFGVCSATKDPKIVKITYAELHTELESISSIPFQVEVFMLSTGAWRTLSRNLPRISLHFEYVVEIDGIVYFLVTDRITVDGGRRYLIISFDITREEFEEIKLPNMLARSRQFSLSISKLRESLVLIEHTQEHNRMVYNLWMMEGGLYTKLYTFNVNTPDLGFVRGLGHSGQLMIVVVVDGRYDLVVYERQSNHMEYLGFDGVSYQFCVQPYMETLLLHDNPNLTVPT